LVDYVGAGFKRGFSPSEEDLAEIFTRADAEKILTRTERMRA
jgi:hypothetical protein